MIETSQIAALSLDYNTDREDLRMPEYGRHVQSMIEYCLSLPDRERRTKVANSIIDVIGNLNPSLRDNPDYRHKLWDHLFVMSDFALDVDCPYPTPTREKLSEKPDAVPYPQKSRSHRYYGNIVQNLITTVSDMEPSEDRDAMELDIANQMKRAYLSWNKDSVDDAVIFAELRILSAGKLGQEKAPLSVNRGVVSQNAPLHTRTKKKAKPTFKRKTNFKRS
ncbi:MAG TPA: DUF4290 domain-containing protein [Cryomorphaceae bacterium]|jgi:hypothetical protein|nr:MAG: hypothetical protein ABR88_05830 [Cryomorphaceae bacterium BACL7 MAG-120322-bin74]KRO82546.1 MAG: hypothetical protein ABR87_06480 [Cryomorphaceae bacterium BACL7 MAG-121220-bin83]NQW26069.1 DUF4290 domain-containing protein [Cryomorphaceae bacterium]HAG49121.1 DUF4290 domain-containing protein [Cryomorphaceae bacterium]